MLDVGSIVLSVHFVDGALAMVEDSGKYWAKTRSCDVKAYREYNYHHHYYYYSSTLLYDTTRN